MKKKIMSVLLAAALVVGMLPSTGTKKTASAQTAEEAGGTLADADGTAKAFSWSLDKDGVLTITREGDSEAAMPDYAADTYTSAPWYSYAADITKVVVTGAVNAIGAYSFHNAKGVYSALTEVDFSGITADSFSIKKYAFAGTAGSKSALETVTGGDKITEAYSYAFSYSMLSEVSFSSLATADTYLFNGCSELRSAYLPALTKVPGYLFNGCLSLTYVYLDNVASWGNWAFAYCDSLQRIYLSSGLPEITSALSAEVFCAGYDDTAADTTKLYLTGVQIFLPTEDKVYWKAYLKNYTSLDGNTTSLLQYYDDVDEAFAKEPSVKIAAADCDQQASPALTFAENSGNGEYTCYYYKSYVGSYSKLTRYSLVDEENPETVPETPGHYYVQVVTTETEDYWSTSSNYAAFTVYGELANDGWTYNNKTGLLTITSADVVKTDYADYTEVPWYAYEYNEEVTKVVFSDGVEPEKIGDYVFWGLYNAVSIPLPDTAASIGAYAYYNCRAWADTVAIENTITSLGEYAFYYCESLNGTFSLENVTEIPQNCFRKCKKITSVVISEKLESLGTYFLGDCTSLTEFTFPEDSPVTEIPKYAFAGCTGITKMELPSKVTLIDNYAFYGCTGLEAIELPDSLTEIGLSAFIQCKSLSELVLPEGILSLGSNVISGCVSLTELTLPSTLTTLAGAVFNGSYVEYLQIPESVTYIGSGCFRNANGLKVVWFESDTLTSDEFIASSETSDNMFEGITQNCGVVAEGTTYETLSAYQALGGWSDTVTLYSAADIEGLLAEGVSMAESLTDADYTSSLREEFQAAIQAASELAESGSTEMEQIVNQLSAIQAMADAARIFLADSISQAESLVESDYDTEGDGMYAWWDYLDAYDDAVTIYADSTATFSNIIAADTALRTALDTIVMLPTDEAEAALAETLVAAKALTESDYTEESWQTLQEAIEAAETLGDMATISQYEAAQQKVEEAIAALVKTASEDDSNSDGSNSSGSGNSSSSNSSQKVTVKKATLKSVKSKKKKTITVKWKKLSNVTGYQIQIGTNKKVTKGKKTYKVKKAKTTSKTIKKLKSKKKYYVRVRAYKTANGKTTYGKWSKVKKVKVK